MTCEDVLDLVEPIASGDVAVDESARRHLETCPACASALAEARRIDGWLRARPVMAAPPRFTTAVMGRIRRDRWKAEQRIDRVFNAAMIAAAVLILAGGAVMLNVRGVLAMAAQASTVMAAAGELALQRAVPEMSTYIAATGLLVSAAVMWWWADTSTQR